MIRSQSTNQEAAGYLDFTTSGCLSWAEIFDGIYCEYCGMQLVTYLTGLGDEIQLLLIIVNLILTIALSLAYSLQSSCLVVQLINLPTSMLLLVEIFYYVMSLYF